jgi:hypothetical protein
MRSSPVNPPLLSLLLVSAGLLLRCGDEGGGESTADDAEPTQSPMPNDSVPGPSASTSGGGEQEGQGGEQGSGPEMVEPEPTSEPPPVLGTIAPGEPEELLGDLALPGRVAFDGDGIVLIDHRHYVDPAEPDKLLRIPKTGGEPTVLLEAASIEGFLLLPDQIWINSYVEHAVIVYDRVSGLRVHEARLPSEQYPTQLVATADRVLAALTPQLSLIEIDRTTGAGEVFWASSDEGSATWLQLAGERLIVPANYRNKPSELTALSLDGTLTHVLLQAEGQLRSVAVSGEEVVFTDSAGTVGAVPSTGGDMRVVAPLLSPWGVLVDGDTLYVSSQPEYCNDDTLGAVYSVPLAGGTPLQLATAQRCPSGLLADEDALYWVNNGDSTPAVGDTPFAIVPNGSLVKLPR